MKGYIIILFCIILSSCYNDGTLSYKNHTPSLLDFKSSITSKFLGIHKGDTLEGNRFKTLEDGSVVVYSCGIKMIVPKDSIVIFPPIGNKLIPHKY